MKKLSFKSKWLPGVMLFLIGLIYFSFLPVNYDFDGTVFSQYLRYAVLKNDLAAANQPQHPLYIPVNYILYQGLQKTLGYNVLEYFHLQLFSLCFGLLAMWMIYKIIKQLTGPDQHFIHLAGMALVAFAYGPWYYSVEAEVHMAGLFFIAFGMYLLFFKPGDQDKLSRALGASGCFVLAAGFHLANVLIAAAVLLIFILQQKSFLKILRFFVFYGIFMLVELSFFFLVNKLNLLNFYKNELQGNDIQAGYNISYWTGVSFGALWESLKSVANCIFYPASSLLSFLSIIILLVGAALIIYGGIKSKNKTYFKLGSWLLPYFVFFTFWDHRNLEFKLNVFFPFMILLILSAAFFISRMSNKTWVYLANVGILILIFSVFLINFNFYMKPANRIENNRYYMVAEAVAKVTPPQAAIVIAGCGDSLSIHNKINISYFALRRVYILDWMLGKGMTLEDIYKRLEIEHGQGIPIYFFSDTLQGKAASQLLENHHLEAKEYSQFLEKIDFKEKVPLIDGYYLSRM